MISLFYMISYGMFSVQRNLVSTFSSPLVISITLWKHFLLIFVNRLNSPKLLPQWDILGPKCQAVSDERDFEGYEPTRKGGEGEGVKYLDGCEMKQLNIGDLHQNHV